MAVQYEDQNRIVCQDRVYENELEPLKKYLDSKKEALEVDLSACKDMHGAVIQLLLAYQVQYGCEFILPEVNLPFKMAIEGFSSIENDCH